MAKYKAYPEYKYSEIEWLGKIPSGWLLKKAKYIFQRVQRPLRDIDGVVTAFRDGQVTLRTNRRTDGFTNSVKEIGYQGVRRNDLVIHAMDGFAGAIGVSDSDGKCSPVCSVCIPWQNQPLNMRFYGYLVRQLAVTDFILSLAKGIRERSTEFRFSEFSGLMLPIPPIYEQDQIAKFLDHETAKIDNLIEKQQQLIELLKEKRQAVISHAVTKGLNPDVPMKDSGVEWLGEIPQHWGVTRLKYECRNIVDCPHSTPNYTDEGEYPAIRTADILAGYLDLENCRRVTEPVYDERNFRLIPKAGDIIYSREGERFGIGAPIPEGAKVCLAQRVMLFRAKSTPGYLMWALNSSSTYTQAQQDCIGSTSPHVNVDTIKNFILAWPPENEREEISNFIHQTLDSVESLTAHLTEKLTLLQERRTALISAAVTGKIDVRDWVAPDTQDVEEPQEATA
ncbi:TPA: restriction endonuclease subunit S [Klebsiella pneumoniae]|uniref:restriction endonuclease subunit S n=1 Tax=Klebsiella TaxID=570 RepID=UPI000808DB3E|nr:MULTISPECIES: restriction endonuclease subunit S [Klebsiella]HBR6112161.1 restriction endonuclease subunit S [Klebsiella pneumoniae]MBU8954078.1 restriction endonuclease subunit S [Klebsiella quasipneumoniae]MBY0594711.1 restriction endonuclease subunit S [Klebsiella sp. TFW1]MBY0605538.1 restriction endonuclease subunit S [Klebsiella sp. TF21-TM]SCA28574.1 restriction endonuclease subunit S [Klebsiella quasipneumoniae]